MNCPDAFSPFRLPQRKQQRLKGYDYSSSGCYFVTLCTKEKKTIFGDIRNGHMILNDTGLIASNNIEQIPKHYTTVFIDKYVVMPNHVHLLISIDKLYDQTERVNPFPTQQTNLSGIIGKYKAGVTREIKIVISGQEGNVFMRSEKGRITRPETVEQNKPEEIWQKSFYDHIIRNESDYQNIWVYIDTNPMKWGSDCFYKKCS